MCQHRGAHLLETTPNYTCIGLQVNAPIAFSPRIPISARMPDYFQNSQEFRSGHLGKYG
jgi:hypothetical protein